MSRVSHFSRSNPLHSAVEQSADRIRAAAGPGWTISVERYAARVDIAANGQRSVSGPRVSVSACKGRKVIIEHGRNLGEVVARVLAKIPGTSCNVRQVYDEAVAQLQSLLSNAA